MKNVTNAVLEIQQAVLIKMQRSQRPHINERASTRNKTFDSDVDRKSVNCVKYIYEYSNTIILYAVSVEM